MFIVTTAPNHRFRLPMINPITSSPTSSSCEILSEKSWSGGSNGEAGPSGAGESWEIGPVRYAVSHRSLAARRQRRPTSSAHTHAAAAGRAGLIHGLDSDFYELVQLHKWSEVAYSSHVHSTGFAPGFLRSSGAARQLRPAGETFGHLNKTSPIRYICERYISRSRPNFFRVYKIFQQIFVGSQNDLRKYNSGS